MYEKGDRAFFSKTITESDVNMFAGVSGDFNPVHIDKEYAGKTVFKERIAHGALLNAFISTVIGMKIPGMGTIYMEQNTKFVKPVYIGDTVTAIVVVDEIINVSKGIYKLSTTVINQRNELCVDGYAVVKYIE